MGGIGSSRELLRRLRQRRPEYQWTVEVTSAIFGGAYKIRAEVMGHLYVARIARASMSHPEYGVLDYLIRSADDTLEHIREPKPDAKGHGQSLDHLFFATVAPPNADGERSCTRITAFMN
jgi:predicted pyridoxine 5'-phosphate oxidase superfamily flavin-nucleotide-binding protein